MFKIEDYNNKKIAIHVETQEEYDKLIYLLKKSGVDTKELNVWKHYKENTCINIEDNKLQWCYKKWYEEEVQEDEDEDEIYQENIQYSIVEFSDINQFTKSDLQDTDIVTLKNNTRHLWREAFKSDFKEDLTNTNLDNHDIIKVERPTNLVTVYEREETVKVSLDELVKCYEEVHKVKVEVE